VAGRIERVDRAAQELDKSLWKWIEFIVPFFFSQRFSGVWIIEGSWYGGMAFMGVLILLVCVCGM
jgi:hypothetical protein